MTGKVLLNAFALAVAALPISAAGAMPMPAGPAPDAGPLARYCLRVEAVTGTRLETIQCWTREQWADLGVDVDKDWAKEGVAVKP